MATEAFDSNQVQRYSIRPRRSLIAMVSRRTLRRVNGTAGLFLVRPVVVMAARALGPGPTRLKLVKLAHNLGGRELVGPGEELEFVDAASQSQQRAA